jgi:hypothetical protein
MTDIATEEAVNDDVLVVIATFSRDQAPLAGHPGQIASSSNNKCVVMGLHGARYTVT